MVYIKSHGGQLTSLLSLTRKIIINVPVVYMAEDVMILMRARSITRALKIGTFLGPEMAKSEATAIWAQKSRDFQGPPLPMARVKDCPHQIH